MYVLLYYIITLWDHRRIRGPSLTETSLCGAYLHCLLSVTAATYRPYDELFCYREMALQGLIARCGTRPLALTFVISR